MKLTELNPKFLKRDDSHHFRHVETIGEADGLWFLCPKCFLANGGAKGTHGVICWSPSVPQDTSPTPGRWNLVGSSFDNLSLVAGSSSVQLNGGCSWHGYVKNGEVTDA
jgi:hypothetical protein